MSNPSHAGITRSCRNPPPDMRDRKLGVGAAPTDGRSDRGHEGDDRQNCLHRSTVIRSPHRIECADGQTDGQTDGHSLEQWRCTAHVGEHRCAGRGCRRTSASIAELDRQALGNRCSIP